MFLLVTKVTIVIRLGLRVHVLLCTDYNKLYKVRGRKVIEKYATFYREVVKYFKLKNKVLTEKTLNGFKSKFVLYKAHCSMCAQIVTNH